MSFDLCVFYSDEPLTYEQGRDQYWRLIEGDWEPAETHARVDAFRAELTGKYPEVDETEESKADSCPWSCAFDRIGLYTIIPIRWDCVNRMVPIVKGLARNYELVCLDPQKRVIHLPGGLSMRSR